MSCGPRLALCVGGGQSRHAHSLLVAKIARDALRLTTYNPTRGMHTPSDALEQSLRGTVRATCARPRGLTQSLSVTVSLTSHGLAAARQYSRSSRIDQDMRGAHFLSEIDECDIAITRSCAVPIKLFSRTVMYIYYDR